jgi:hypothetical protein
VDEDAFFTALFRCALGDSVKHIAKIRIRYLFIL